MLIIIQGLSFHSVAHAKDTNEELGLKPIDLSDNDLEKMGFTKMTLKSDEID